MDAHHVQSIIQILTEPPRLHLLHQILVGGGQHPPLDSQRLVGPPPASASFLLLDGQEQLRPVWAIGISPISSRNSVPAPA